MSSVQERLQMKRVPVDTWSTKEQLCLASSVVRSGDQNWMSVSRTLKSLGDPNRPSDWFSQKSCAAQYGSLLEHVETPKRKKRTADGAAESPQESIFKRLTVDRLAELHKNMAELRQQYDKIKEEIDEIRSPNISDTRVREMCASMDLERRTRDREISRHSQWLREREERKVRAERGWRPSGSGAPLLTSLLKSAASPTTGSTVSSVTVASSFDGSQQAVSSPAQAQMIQHIMPHPSTLPDIVSPSAGAPTLSMLLEKPASGSVLPPLPPPPTDNNKIKEIEHIKNQLQAIEQKLNGGVPVPQSPLVASPIPRSLPVITIPLELPGKAAAEDKIEIDDIEIKAEDVYAFSDIDIEIPPVSSIHKSSLGTRVMDRNLFNKKESNLGLGSLEDLAGPSDFPNVLSNSELESRKTATPAPEITLVPEVKEEILCAQPKEEPLDETVDSSISVEEVPVEMFFPESEIVQEQGDSVEKESGPTAEPSNVEIEEEPPAITAIETPAEQTDLETTSGDNSEVINEPPSTNNVAEETVEDLPEHVPEISEDPEPSSEQQTQQESEKVEEVEPEKVIEYEEKVIEEPVKETIVEPEPEITETEPVVENEKQEEDGKEEEPLKGVEETIPATLTEDIPLPKEPAPPSEPFRIPTPEIVSAKPEEPHLPQEVEKKEVEAEKDKEEAEKEKVDPDKEELIESQAETDDDTPMEVAREEDKLGRTKRDYSRRRTDAHRSEFSDDAQSDTSLPGPMQDKKPPKGTSSRPWSPATPGASPAGSPAPSRDSTHDDDKDYRLWKKSIMLVYSRLCAHKYASLFLRPITDDHAPGYSIVVRRPMDLSTIRKNIDSGVIKTTVEFQHDVLLMLSNALMYNNSTHRVHFMAQEMFREAAAQLGMLLQAQAHAELSMAPRAPPASAASANAKRKRTSQAATPPPPKKRRDD